MVASGHADGDVLSLIGWMKDGKMEKRLITKVTSYSDGL